MSGLGKGKFISILKEEYNPWIVHPFISPDWPILGSINVANRLFIARVDHLAPDISLTAELTTIKIQNG